MQSPESINHLLSRATGTLDQIVQTSARLRKLTSVIQRFLPTPLNQHCQVGSIRDNCLVLIADSPAWTTTLRYQVPALLEHLRQQGFSNICNIRTKTSPQHHQHNRNKARQHHMSDETAALISNLASTVVYPKLRNALLRLASTYTTTR